MTRLIIAFYISTMLTACASTSKQGDISTSEGKVGIAATTSSLATSMDDDKVFLECQEFTGGTVTSRWVVKNTLDYAVKYTYKLRASSSHETILVPGRQSELISNYAGYCEIRASHFLLVRRIGNHCTFLDMQAFGKGFAWANGHNLGRHWNIGPQRALYFPAATQRKGENSVIVFDLDSASDARVSGVKEQVWSALGN